MTAAVDVSDDLWAVEPSGIEGQARIRARIAGLHCSLCTGTIEKALGRMPGVQQVAVSLTHEQALDRLRAGSDRPGADPGNAARHRLRPTTTRRVAVKGGRPR